MMIGAESTHSPDSDATDWPDAWSQLNGWRRWLTVTGAEHFSFTDLPYLANQLGLSDPAVPLPGARGWLITRDYVTAFFDLHLRDMPQPILDGPTTAHPEVVFGTRCGRRPLRPSAPASFTSLLPPLPLPRKHAGCQRRGAAVPEPTAQGHAARLQRRETSQAEIASCWSGAMATIRRLRSDGSSRRFRMPAAWLETST